MSKHQKVVWVTGASTGIGADTAMMLAKQGWSVALTARNAEALLNLQAMTPPGKLFCYPGDVTDSQRMKDIVAQIITHLGRLDMVILNAGMYEADNIETFASERFAHTMNVNVNGVANALDPALKHFRTQGQGHIAVVASVAGYHGLPGSLSYGPSKAALINLCEALAIELRGTKIKMQMITPGFVKTRLTDQNNFKMPMIISSYEAAEHIVSGLSKGSFEITFPLIFSRMLRFIGSLPYMLSIPLLRAITRGQTEGNQTPPS